MKLKKVFLVLGIICVLVGFLLTIASLNSSYTLNILVDDISSGHHAADSDFSVAALQKVASFTKYLSYGVFSEILGILFVIVGWDSRRP
ncbi:hypothetical protein JTE88_01960 [Arcanobacterium phocisimile]|uniref:Uncharacterized protein n=1 Tax=Arcanobacterium phocisimile TaxID=1302235 RepID=A0ABX7IL32_9ACTO|nr:hypothetical protein [Arcanobacterium phocisimile]QRV02543.1 hypothetical protein JTE88_01960 [Arcanobacterium phocisimile]